MRLRIAVLAAVCAALLAAECELPFEPEEGHSILYLHVLPSGSSFVYPGEEEFAAAADEIREYFLEVSYGQYRLQGDDDPATSGDILGPLVVPAAFHCGLDSPFISAALAHAALTTGIDLDRYEHVVVVAPGVGCSFNGVYYDQIDTVYVNAQTLYYVGNGTSGPPVIAHELGHQLGLQHSRALRCPMTGFVFDAGCDDGEYLDLLDVLGTSVFFGHYNAFQKAKLGWLPPTAIVEVTESGRYFLTPYEVRSLGPKMLRVRRQRDSWLTVEYRTPTGFDAQGIPGFTDGAIVHLVRPRVTRVGEAHSFLLTGPSGRFALLPGESMEDVRGHTIRVVAKTPGGILLDVELAPAAELDPPSFSLSFLGDGPGRTRITVSAVDASGIDSMELYTRRPGPSRFDWTGSELLETILATGETSFDGDFVVDSADLAGGWEVVVFDREGNAAYEVR
jgi:M6 family metalloprotease-like protein